MLTIEQLESRDCPSVAFDLADFALEGGKLSPPDGRTVDYIIDPSLARLQGVTLAQVRTSIEAALDEWVSRIPLRLVQVDSVNVPSGQPVVEFSAGDIDPQDQILAESTPPANSYFGTLKIIYNTATPWTVSEDGPLTTLPANLRKVTEHEWGHILGLAHEEDPAIPAIMSPFYHLAPPHPTQDDIDGVIPLYGAGLGTVVPLRPQGIGAFDPATATWYLRNEQSAGAPDAGVFRFGAPGWTPEVGQWDGIGADRIGVVDPTTNTLYEAVPGGVRTVPYVPTETPAPPVDLTTETWHLPGIDPFAYGAPGWVPVVGRWL